MKAVALAMVMLIFGLAVQVAPLAAADAELEVPRMTIKLPGGSISSLSVSATVYVDEALAPQMKQQMGAIRQEVFSSAFESFIGRRSRGYSGIDATLLQERIAMGLTAQFGPAPGLRVLFRELSTQ